MKLSEKMLAKEKMLASLGWQSFQWFADGIYMCRNDAVCKIDKRGQTRYHRQDEIQKIKKDAQW